MRKGIAFFTVAAVCAFLLLVLACSPRHELVETTTGMDFEVESPEWSISSDCSSCHTAEAKSANNLQTAYAKHSDQTCIACHSDASSNLAKAHEKYMTAKRPSKLKRTEVSNDTCISCHTVEEIIAQTADVVTLVDKNGLVVNPHDVPQTTEHLKSITCANCHNVHSTVAYIEAAKKTCLGCHHADIYECGTCHE
jgi:hypothetical protein